MNKFTEADLQIIYKKKVKKNASYFNKYKSLPDCPVKRWNNNWRGHDMPRNFAILDFIDWTKKYRINTGTDLAITGTSDPELEIYNI